MQFAISLRTHFLVTAPDQILSRSKNHRLDYSAAPDREIPKADDHYSKPTKLIGIRNDKTLATYVDDFRYTQAIDD